MFWKVAGFSQPSPIEQILDKDEYTLEELLDEDDILQECKSLNGRLVAFLRERSTVEQLVRYLVDPPLDADDPKRAYKFPFTACEVLCCEVEAVFNTLLEDAELMQLLFSLLDAPSPLNSKTAGYFGRVVGHLLLRKTNEVVQYLQEHPQLLERLVQHVDTASIAEILKRLVGADEQSSVLFLAQYAPWLAETPLVELLLGKLAHGSSTDAQANSADILSAIAHTQPSPLASTLTRLESVAALFTHGMAPGQQVLVPVLDVCIALIEPRRSAQAMEDAPMQDAAYKAKMAAVDAIVPYVPSLVDLLRISSNTTGGAAAAAAPVAAAAAAADSGAADAAGAAIPPSPSSLLPAALETPYGMLTPPLGRSRLKAVELLAVLLRSGSPAVEQAVMQTGAVSACLQLFGAYPFNNLLHHCVVAMLVAILTKSSGAMLQHIFEQCRLIEWLVNLPTDIKPTPIPGQEELAAAKPLIRAGYMGHITQIASTLESFTSQGSDAGLPTALPGGSAAGVGPGGEASHAAAAEGDAAAAAAAAVAQSEAGSTAQEPASSGGAAASGAGGLEGGGEGGGASAAAAVPVQVSVNAYLKSSVAWSTYLHEVLQPRQELENTSRWQCGRPTATELAGLDSDGDEFQAEMELEHMVGMQPVLYHRYHIDENEGDDDNEDDNDDDDNEDQELLKASGYNPHHHLHGGGGPGGGGGLGGGGPQHHQAVTDAMGNMELNEEGGAVGPAWQELHVHGHEAGAGLGAGYGVEEDKGPGGLLQGLGTHEGLPGRQAGGMEDDEVLLATSDDDDTQRPDSSGMIAQGMGGDELLQPQAMAVSFPMSEQPPEQQAQQALQPSGADAEAAALLLQPQGAGGAVAATGGEGMTWQPGPATGATQ